MAESLIQYAALPYRADAHDPQVLLITSRETRRWILPKGKPKKGLQPWQVAEEEAYEEAGVRGSIFKEPFGRFQSTAGGIGLVTLQVYLLEVTEILDRWPEKHERERRWLAPAQAALTVEEGGLVQVLLTFASKWD